VYSLGTQTRWMAPELILALVEDEGHSLLSLLLATCTLLLVYVWSDIHHIVWFDTNLSVLSKVATGQVPYPHRTNDHAVTVDIMRGVRPTREYLVAYGAMTRRRFGRCSITAGSLPHLRPSMSELTPFLKGQTGLPAVYVTRWLSRDSTWPALNF